MTTIRRLQSQNRRLKDEIQHLKSADGHIVRVKLMQKNMELEQRYLEAMSQLQKMNKLLNKYKLLIGDIDVVDFHKDKIDEL